MIYIGVTLLGWPEEAVWRMTPYKILELFRIHREFNPARFGKAKSSGMDDIDAALGGL